MVMAHWPRILGAVVAVALAVGSGIITSFWTQGSGLASLETKVEEKAKANETEHQAIRELHKTNIEYIKRDIGDIKNSVNEIKNALLQRVVP